MLQKVRFQLRVALVENAEVLPMNVDWVHETSGKQGAFARP